MLKVMISLSVLLGAGVHNPLFSMAQSHITGGLCRNKAVIVFSLPG